MLRDAGTSNLPPPTILHALRQPRRPQLGDRCVKALLARWKRLGFPIEYADLNRVADVLGVARRDAKTRKRIVAAVEAAGIEIHNFDGLRQRVAETFVHISLTADAMSAMVEESRWREPEEWDAAHSQPRPAARPSEWLFRRQEKRRQGGPLWFLFPHGRHTSEAQA